MSYLLHGIVNAGHPLKAAKGGPAGADAARIREAAATNEGQPDQEAAELLSGLELIEHNGVAVVVRQWSDEKSLTEDDAIRHLDVLVQLVQDGPVLPLRLGTVAPDAEAILNEVLGPDAVEDLRQRIDAVADMVELRVTFTLDEDTVQAHFNEDAELRALVSRTGPNADLAERVELGQQVAEHLAARRAELIGRWVDTLSVLVEDATSLASSDEGWEQIAFLVRRDRLDDMDAAVTHLAHEVGARARIEYVGPLPIYSFDDIEAAAPPAASAAPQESRWGW